VLYASFNLKKVAGHFDKLNTAGLTFYNRGFDII